ncbi:MAG TPA: LysR family transcriptional regulator [Pusillimonas sp.]|jgi:DNA-binding transcriptional LysR family regulator|nr:LysR family transcriptional regulator [Pusillimonas sp.]MBC42612.1 LysR family transcriptional regulator [Pusillimonas sp.]HBT31372.1 LysR family transcriptional regulator [Pusillimonas sp.]HCN73721.1 LysR family transcriptional regulator [Pusillimonas sp.]HCP78978.1 LysR family transcriptional regulator [Pusillimonas sp.]|tara:strand:+ start:19726 stop:20649 length:924 start_codon:yes stop_codon:yes gene_type:complete
MNINDLDLNLLRLFDAVYTYKKVSLAADSLGISQPAASQGLSRLRSMFNDSLFVRATGGVKPTPRAERLATSVRNALDILNHALTDTDVFEPAHSQRVFRIQMMSDMGEDRFLPGLLAEIEHAAPRIKLETVVSDGVDLSHAMDNGQVDFAFGYFPRLHGSRSLRLFDDRYVVLSRKGHPLQARAKDNRVPVALLQTVEFAGVETHADTLRMLKLLGMESRLRLVTQHFMTLPAIVRATNLCAVVPSSTAHVFNRHDEFDLIEPEDLPLRNFTVSLYWSRRFDEDAGVMWFKQLARKLFAKPPYKLG